MTATTGPEGPTGVIHDIGYRHYDGVRQGRRHAFAALTLHGLRAVFGLGRPARAKIMPILLIMIMMLPAVVFIAVLALAQQRALGYTGYVITMQVVVAIFLAAQAPVLVAPDLRFRVLPLYLSRPVTVLDYVGAKLLALTAALFGLLALPMTVMFVGELLVDPPGPPHTAEYLANLGGAVGYAVLLAFLGLALAAATPRRGLGVAAVIAVYVLSAGVSGILFGLLDSLGQDAAGRLVILINPFFLADALQVAIFGTEPATTARYPDGPVAPLCYLALVALCALALVLRYRKAATS